MGPTYNGFGYKKSSKESVTSKLFCTEFSDITVKKFDYNEQFRCNFFTRCKRNPM